MTPLLEVKGLQMHLHVRRGVLRAVDGVDLRVEEGQTVGLVGESGSGKTMTGLSLLRLLPRPAGRITGGSVKLDGEEILTLSERQMARTVRGRRIAMIAQDPMTALNPVFSIGDQVGQPFRNQGQRGVRSAVVGVLRRVQIPSAERRLGDFPFQFSGGQRQRVATAMAIAPSPRLLIADEPTTALDVTVQAQIINLLRRIQADTRAGIILITHDLGVAASLCHRVAVMYAGRVVEDGPVADIYKRPAHPYTQALLGAIPRLGSGNRRLVTIPGQPPSLLALPSGCRFAPRCSRRMPICDEYPPTMPAGVGHTAACWLLR